MERKPMFPTLFFITARQDLNGVMADPDRLILH